jgi:predicted glycosyltransferase
LKIWFDVLTPKQLLFFEPMIRKLQKNNKLFCTSRNYREVVELAKIRGINLVFVGKHGGSDKIGKLNASLTRMQRLLSIVKKFNPELTVSFCSPEASRISYGLGVKHIAFCDSPHAEAVMRLSLPIIQRLLIPWIIPKKEFTKYGISEEKISQYKAIDASVIVKERSKNDLKYNFLLKKKKTILIRPEESEAAYVSDNENRITKIIREIIKEFPNYNVIILGRYLPQISQLKREFGSKVIVMDKVVDGKSLLKFVDVFIGSGGTMTAEAALMGVPTISYNAVPNYIEQYLVKKGLVKREENPQKIVFFAKKILKSNNRKTRNKAKKILSSMEDPFSKLITHIKT